MMYILGAKLVKYTAKCPNIRTHAVGLVVAHLRREVKRRANASNRS